MNAPHVTPEHIDSIITNTLFKRIEDTCLTICVLTLKNGFTVTGESACASPENYNRCKGEKYSKENAVEKIWALEGYLLKEKLSQGIKPTTYMERIKLEIDELSNKIDKLLDFTGTTNFKALEGGKQRLMDDQLQVMKSYLSILTVRHSVS
jgi:hypothetical protein